ncbi:MAG: phosphoribosyltransferase [Chthoniobacterales bacterium]
MKRFHNREEAGRLLALRLGHYANRPDVIILALPRGGVPVGYEVSHALNTPLDVLVVRKLGVPGHEEMAMGAIATGAVRLLNLPMISALHITPHSVVDVERRELAELERREKLYRGSRPRLETSGKTVILVDDGIATGSTMQAAIASLRQRQVERIVVATPVAPPSVLEILRQLADEVVCAMTPEDFRGVGQWYDDFSQTSDEEVHFLLSASAPEATHLQLLTS